MPFHHSRKTLWDLELKVKLIENYYNCSDFNKSYFSLIRINKLEYNFSLKMSTSILKLFGPSSLKNNPSLIKIYQQSRTYNFGRKKIVKSYISREKV